MSFAVPRRLGGRVRIYETNIIANTTPALFAIHFYYICQTRLSARKQNIWNRNISGKHVRNCSLFENVWGLSEKSMRLPVF